MRLFLAAFLVLHAASVGYAQQIAESDWPQWRGPTRDGFVRNGRWPERLKTDNFKEIWTKPLGPGYPGPLVMGDKVFVGETKDRKVEVVRALDRKTGKQLWEASWEGSLSVPFFAKANGDWIRSTPACDGESVFVGGIRDLLVCLDAATGKERWRYDFVKETKSPVPAFGFVCSPLLDGDYVFVQAGSGLAKLEKKTGKLAWHVLKGGDAMMGSAFSSPSFATLAGKRQLLVQTRTALVGVDPESGDKLWSQEIPAFRGMNILTPVLFNDGIFTSAYGAKSYLYRPSADGKVETAWTNKLQAYMSSPIIHDGHAYVHLRNQTAACIDLKTGETKWNTSERFGQYWSMVASGDRILALDERGMLFSFRATPEKFDLIDRHEVTKTSSWAHLAVSGDEVFVRSLDKLHAFRWSR
ncbi:MAG: PQQ-binding-like beta-propeller repeat protein [Gemmataceae bacterium]|nr:PQQ-binding-like beta-propeller repeat protein [Gemmataceae bacterium]